MGVQARDSANDRFAIIERLHRYSWGYDARDLDMLKESFTSNARMTISLQGTPGWGPFVGREVIVDWMAGVMKTQSDQRRHSMTNVVFDELTSAHAVVRSFLVLTAAEKDVVRLVTTGAYRVEAIRESDEWRISDLDLTLD